MRSLSVPYLRSPRRRFAARRAARVLPPEGGGGEVGGGRGETACPRQPSASANMREMQMRSLGSSGPQVAAIGLGAMGMSGMYGESDRAESIATIHAALDAGINLIDTGDFYGMGHNELLIHEALRDRP